MSTVNAAEDTWPMGEPAGASGPAPAARSLAIRAATFGAGVAALLGVAAATGPTDVAPLAGDSGFVVPFHTTCCPGDPNTVE
ncbi:hypothetical protein ACQPYA_18095 [Micromonospora sp. CA-263727]|uniref:hypothetical protein n=1 Tax=Micromonospora sp. CA-263727 TaxID=3239967 RepID=UPI003D8D650B